MSTFMKGLLTFLGCFLVLAVGVTGVAVYEFFDSMCGNEVLAEVPSPDGEHKVVVFQRDCGATTGFSTQLSLLPAADALDNDGGNLFVADTGHGAAPSGPGGGPVVDVRWIDSANLEVTHDPRARVQGATEVSEVRIVYRAEWPPLD